MYKIKYIPTGNIFILPGSEVKGLKEQFPNDYQILEKNGKKFRDCIKKKKVSEDNSIRSKVVEE